MKKIIWVMLLMICLIVTGCQKKTEPEAETATAVEPAQEPDRLEVQHILISFKGAIDKEEVTRTQAEAETLAQKLLTQAQAGEDFDAMVKEYTDDQHPGIYRMANLEIEPDSSQEEYPRARMVKAFGDVSFSLKVGEIGMTTFDPETSKYGWHIIKRLK